MKENVLAIRDLHLLIVFVFSEPGERGQQMECETQSKFSNEEQITQKLFLRSKVYALLGCLLTLIDGLSVI